MSGTQTGKARGKRLVLIGGGHAHMVTLAGLHRFVEMGVAVTVVQPSEHHYYSGMGPGMLGRFYTPDQIRFDTRRRVEMQGGRFVLDRAVRIDRDSRQVALASGKSIDFDVLSVNAGSHVPTDRLVASSENVFPVKPIEQLIEAQRRIIALSEQKSASVAVIGGGPSAVEIAGNLWRLGRYHADRMPRIRIVCRDGLLPQAPARVRRLAERSLARREMTILDNATAEEIQDGRIRLASGDTIEADVIFVAVGVRPSPLPTESDLPTDADGGMLVNRYLQSIADPDIFGGGDCVALENRPLDKVGVYAVRQNPVLYSNLMARLSGSDLAAFEPQPEYLLVYNLGDGTGIFHKGGLTFNGRLAFLIKDRIDRRFIRTFQK